MYIYMHTYWRTLQFWDDSNYPCHHMDSMGFGQPWFGCDRPRSFHTSSWMVRTPCPALRNVERKAKSWGCWPKPVLWLTLDAPKKTKCLLWIMPHLAWVSRFYALLLSPWWVQRVAVLPKVDVGKGLGQGCGTPIDIGKTIAQQPAVLRSIS